MFSVRKVSRILKPGISIFNKSKLLFSSSSCKLTPIDLSLESKISKITHLATCLAKKMQREGRGSVEIIEDDGKTYVRAEIFMRKTIVEDRFYGQKKSVKLEVIKYNAVGDDAAGHEIADDIWIFDILENDATNTGAENNDADLAGEA